MKTHAAKFKKMADLTKPFNTRADDFRVVVSYSELASYRQCPLKHELEYKQRWTKPPKEGGPLRRGTAWHLILENMYLEIQRGQLDPDLPWQSCEQRAATAAWETFQLLVQKRREHGLAEEDVPVLKWMLEGYIEMYLRDDVKNLLVLGVESKLIVPLVGKNDVGIKLKIDLLVNDLRDDTLWIFDHKTGASLPNDMDLAIDDQFGLYEAGFMEAGIKLEGTVHNAAVTKATIADLGGSTGRSKPKPLDARFFRTVMVRTDNELMSILTDAAAAATVAYWEKLGNRPKLPLFSSPDPRQCSWKCPFKEAHLTMREGTPVERAMKDYGFTVDRTRH